MRNAGTRTIIFGDHGKCGKVDWHKYNLLRFFGVLWSWLSNVPLGEGAARSGKVPERP